MKYITSAIYSAFLATLIQGCGGESTTNQVTTKVLSTQNIPQIKQTSSIENPHVISANTMVKWLNNWEVNRPNHVKGKLVILQVGAAFDFDEKHTFIKHDDKHIFTFNKAGGCSNTDPMFDRTDGVQVIPKAVLSGPMMDAAFAMYDIDPINDMILIVAGGDKKVKGMRENAAATARFAWSMKYWGLKNYAVLDGNIQYMLNPATNPSIKSLGITSLDDLFVEKASIPPMSGTHTVKEISSMHQEVMATLEEMINAITYCPSGSFIVDARSANEYNANNSVKMSKTEAKICGDNHKSQCYTAIEGHIKGAINIEYSDFIIKDDATVDINHDGQIDELDASFRYKTPKEMLEIFTSHGYNPKSQILYTYCRTGTRAALPAFIGTDILKLETKLYDASWIEWGRLAGKEGTVDVNGNILLRSDSPWRTDIASLTEKLTYNPSNLVAPRLREESTLQTDEYACHTDKIKNDDCAYLKN
jgi:3-mercaptopyruvate sulfurtransferase SseA